MVELTEQERRDLAWVISMLKPRTTKAAGGTCSEVAERLQGLLDRVNEARKAVS